MADFDGILNPAAGWPDIPQASDQMLLLGGEGGPLNAQAEAIAARTNLLRANVSEALRRSYAEAGYNVVGTFQAGFTYVNANDVGIDPATGKGYSGPAGPVDAGTDPTSGGFVDMSSALLRSNIARSGKFFGSFTPEPALGRFAVEVVNSDSLGGNGNINTYRKTSSGWWLRERFVTGQYSGSGLGGNCPAWRLGQAFVCPHVLTYKSAIVGGNKAHHTFTITPTQFTKGDNKNTVTFNRLAAAGDYIEFGTLTLLNRISILFAGGSTTNGNVVVDIIESGRVVQTQIVDTRRGSSGLTTFIQSINNPCVGVPCTVRITSGTPPTTVGAECHVAGINASFDDVSDDIDTVKWALYNASIFIRPTQSGAMCYVFQESGSQLMGGESHGGESIVSATVRRDGNIITLSSGIVFSCASFTVTQETLIDWGNGKTVRCNTEHRVIGAGITEFTGEFSPSPGFIAQKAYCPMFTLRSDYFRRIRTPEPYDARALPDPQDRSFEYPFTSIEFLSNDGLITSGISWSISGDRIDDSFVLVNPYGDSSIKFYGGPVSRSFGKTLTTFSVKQKRYYM